MRLQNMAEQGVWASMMAAAYRRSSSISLEKAAEKADAAVELFRERCQMPEQISDDLLQDDFYYVVSTGEGTYLAEEGSDVVFCSEPEQAQKFWDRSKAEAHVDPKLCGGIVKVMRK